MWESGESGSEFQQSPSESEEETSSSDEEQDGEEDDEDDILLEVRNKMCMRFAAGYLILMPVYAGS